MPPGSTAALTEALKRVLSNRSLAETMGANARLLALRQFSSSRYVDRFCELYSRLGKSHVNSTYDA